MKLRSILLLFLLILIPTCLANSLPYWIENLPNNSFNIWTKVNISAGKSICLVIKKEPGYHPDGNKVFLAFDDFDGSELNTNKWMRIDLYNPGLDTANYHTIVENSTLNIGENGDTDGLVFKKQFSGNLVVETKIELDTSTDNIQGGIVFFANNDRSAYVYRIRNTQQNPGWYKLTYFTGTTGDNLITLNYNTYKKRWEILKLVYHDSTFVLYSDNKLIGTAEDSHLKSGYIGLWDGYNSNGKDGAHYDWIFVRKYADKEPIVTVQEVSNSTFIVKITNPNSYNLINFQVAIPGDNIVSSKQDSLFIGEIPYTQVNYYRSIGGYTLTVQGNLGNVSIYLGSALIYTGNITGNHPYQKIFPYDISSYSLKIIYHNYDNISVSYELNPIRAGNYTLTLTPVGNYTNESFYPLIITVSGKSYWISNYSNIPLNISISAYQNTPISITTSLGEEISVPAKTQKVPIFFTTTYSQVKAKTLQGHILEFKSRYGIVGYGQDIDIKIPTGLIITPYLDNFPLQPITVSQNLNLFYNPSLIKREIYAYQTINGKIVVSIKSLLPANFTVLIKGENNTIYLNQSVIPGIYKFNYPDTNQSVLIEVLVNNKVALKKTLVPPGEINNWNNLGDLTKIAVLFILAAILAIVYLSSGLSAALGLTLAGSLILLLPIPERLKPILAATVFLSIMLYLYLRRW